MKQARQVKLNQFHDKRLTFKYVKLRLHHSKSTMLGTVSTGLSSQISPLSLVILLIFGWKLFGFSQATLDLSQYTGYFKKVCKKRSGKLDMRNTCHKFKISNIFVFEIKFSTKLVRISMEIVLKFDVSTLKVSPTGFYQTIELSMLLFCMPEKIKDFFHVRHKH